MAKEAELVQKTTAAELELEFKREQLEESKRVDDAKLGIESQKVIAENSRLDLEKQIKLQELMIKKDSVKEETRRTIFTACIAQGMTASQTKEYLDIMCREEDA